MESLLALVVIENIVEYLVMLCKTFILVIFY